MTLRQEPDYSDEPWPENAKARKRFQELKMSRGYLPTTTGRSAIDFNTYITDLTAN